MWSSKPPFTAFCFLFFIQVSELTAYTFRRAMIGTHVFPLGKLMNKEFFAIWLNSVI